MKKALILVDVQKGFINKQSAWLPTKLANYIKKSDYADVIATCYINNSNTACYKYLGWMCCWYEDEYAICSELDGLYNRVFDKQTYTSVTPELLEYLVENNFSEIHICGISETCCVVATAYDLFDRGFNIKVIPALSAVTGEKEGYKEMADFMLLENVPCLEIEEA